MGNPFRESSGDLLVLDSRNIADSAIADTVFLIERLGLDQYKTYSDSAASHPNSANLRSHQEQ